MVIISKSSTQRQKRTFKTCYFTYHFINHFKTLFQRLNYDVILSTKQRRYSNVLITTSFYKQYKDVGLTSSLQRRFYNYITISLGRLLIGVVFTKLQRQDMVERLRDVKITVIQPHYDVVCLLGPFKPQHKDKYKAFLILSNHC